MAERLPGPEGACGAVFAYGGRVVGFDLFDRPGTLARLWGKLVRAYAIDARTAAEGRPVTLEELAASPRLHALMEVLRAGAEGDVPG